MSRHLGDFDASAVVYGKFTTYRPSTGAPFTLAGTPALSVYKDNSTTQSTTGVTLTVDFDSVTGLNHFAIDTSADGTFYSSGSFFDIVVTTGTVDSVSAVGSIVGSFTIRKNSSLKPSTAGRTAVVDSAGLIDATVVKLGPSGSATAVTARDIGASVLLSSGTGTGQIVLTNGNVTVGTNNDKNNYNLASTQTFNMTGSITGNVSGSVGSVTTVSDKTGYSLSANQTFNVTGNMTGNLSGSVGSVVGNVGGSVASLLGNVTLAATTHTGAIIPNVTTVATTTNLTNLPAITSNWLTAAGIASGALNGKGDWNTVAPDNASITAIKAKTDNLPASPAATGDAMDLTSQAKTDVSNALLDLTSGVETGITVRQALRAICAGIFGQVTGGGSGLETFKALGNPSTTRAVVTVTSVGNRTNVALTLT